MTLYSVMVHRVEVLILIRYNMKAMMILQAPSSQLEAVEAALSRGQSMIANA